MATAKLYKKDVYLKECETRLTALSSEGDHFGAEFEATVFFPEGGGQSSDVGTATIAGRVFKVIAAREKGDSVIHICESVTGQVPAVGATAVLKIDWNHRFDNMQRHCGEHILSGIFHSKYGGVNKGFHMGSDYIAIDIDFEKDERFTELTQAMIEDVELEANKVIWADLPVTTALLAAREDAADLFLRKELTVEHNINIVSVGNDEFTVDCVACCGTHPSSTGQVGLIKIYKAEKNKNMFRVYCEAGRRAFLDYQKKHEIISVLGNKYSTVTDALIHQIEIEERKSREVRSELNKLKQRMVKGYAAEIDEEITAIRNAAGNEILIKEYTDLSIDDLLGIGKFLREPIPKLLLLISPAQNAVVLLSDGKTCDCGKLVKENAPIYHGKGGGRADNARALFTSREYLDTFVDLLEKHLR